MTGLLLLWAFGPLWAASLLVLGGVVVLLAERTEWGG